MAKRNRPRSHGQAYHAPFPALRPYRTACAWRGMTVSGSAIQAGCTPTHLAACLAGDRYASADLVERLEKLLGPEAWAFAMGKTDRLAGDGSQGVAA